MKWRCALIQRRLPDYPDGELSPFWKRHIASHLEVCPDCRQEAADLAEAVSLYQDHPVPDPGPAFWQDFQRELHFKLAQVNQDPEPAGSRLRLPYYLLGASAMAGVLALAVYLGPFSQPASVLKVAQPLKEAQAPAMARPQGGLKAKMATVPPAAPSPPVAARAAAMVPAAKTEAQAVAVAKPEAAPAADPEFSLAAGRDKKPQRLAASEEESLMEDDDLDWDVDSVVADLSREQQENLKSRLESRR
jgi:hypothetical protein